MSRNSVVLLGNSPTAINIVGPPVRADGWHGFSTGLFTVAIYPSDLQGRVYIEGSLATTPAETDWFAISLDGVSPYITFPRNPLAPTGVNGDSGVAGFSFRGNFVWLRARLDRSYLFPPNFTPTEQEIASFGTLDKVLLNN